MDRVCVRGQWSEAGPQNEGKDKERREKIQSSIMERGDVISADTYCCMCLEIFIMQVP
jgi:hypothetical protein